MRARFPGLLVIALVAVACADESNTANTQLSPLETPDGGKCAANEFLYDDHGCNPPGACYLDGYPDAGTCDLQCDQYGDMLCHQRCNSDADCTDRSRPYCRILGLFANYDSNCNAGVRICSEKDENDCPGPVALP